MAKVKKQKLVDPIDKLVYELLKKDVPVILDYDGDLEVYICPVLCDETCSEEPPFSGTYLEYQVSDGLPGVRSSSIDEHTYAKAQEAFAQMSKEHEAEVKRCGIAKRALKEPK